jgi:sarcosine oxidase
MNHQYDVIVLGCGGMGSASLAELSRRGLRVLGLEQFPLVHHLGSSHGETRIIRLAYYEHPDYVPLLRRAFERWHQLEQEFGETLLTECGVLSLGPTNCELIEGVQASTRRHQLAIEHATAREVMQRWPQWRISDDYIGIYEKVAGYLRVERCVEAQLQIARQHGAELYAEEAVLSWQALSNSVVVTTTRGKYHAAKLIIAGGAWNAALLAELNLPLTVMRQTGCWFDLPEPAQFAPEKFPCFIHSSTAGEFYGFPWREGLKLAQHYGANEVASPAEIDRTTSERDEEPLRRFAAQTLTAPLQSCLRRSACMYTLTPDRHFVIDLHPQHNNVVIAGGFSGHGFKFASVLGEITADLATQGATTLPIKMFRATRFASA